MLKYRFSHKQIRISSNKHVVGPNVVENLFQENLCELNAMVMVYVRSQYRWKCVFLFQN